MGPARHLYSMAALLAAGLLLAACGGSKNHADTAGSSSGGSGDPVTSVLVLDGKPVGEGAATPRNTAGAGGALRYRSRVTPDVTKVVTWPAPALLDDGSIDDGPDPFAGEVIQSQPIPIEDDAATTAAIDAWGTRLRKVDHTQWDEWMNSEVQSPWDQRPDPLMSSIVRVLSERCGGARTVATGVVLADETVVTTVHAVESISKRVRVSSGLGDGQRYPAMVRYLDVDDDIAVLKVPGLKQKPMSFHVITGASPQWGYAYGMGRGGVAGTLRRVPAMVAMREDSITVEQPDGFAKQISDRSVFPLVGAVDTGFSGGVVASTNDPDLLTGWGFHGLVRARVPFRSDTAGIVVPGRLVGDAMNASDGLDTWYEHPPGGCPQWRRSR